MTKKRIQNYININVMTTTSVVKKTEAARFCETNKTPVSIYT